MVSKNEGLGRPYGGPTTGAMGANPNPQMQQNAAPMGPDIYGNMPNRSPHTHLSVNDIERLSKAGVKIELEKVVPVPDRDPPDTMATELDNLSNVSNGLSKAIWYRYLQARRALHDPDYGDMMPRPFDLMAHQYGDTVHVSVHPTSAEHTPFILTDNAIIFPSDALMAKIALWEKDHQ